MQIKDIKPTLCKNPTSFVLKKLEQLGYESHHIFPLKGHGAGGLALFWNSKIKIDVMYSNANLIDTFIEYQGKTFFASFIHGDCDRKQRRMQWEHLLNLAASREAPWFAAGDFNDLYSMRTRNWVDQRGRRDLSQT